LLIELIFKVGVLVVSYTFLLACSCRADLLVKKGEERGKIIMMREAWKTERKRRNNDKRRLAEGKGGGEIMIREGWKKERKEEK
jgi:hypothetical protein